MRPPLRSTYCFTRARKPPDALNNPFGNVNIAGVLLSTVEVRAAHGGVLLRSRRCAGFSRRETRIRPSLVEAGGDRRADAPDLPVEIFAPRLFVPLRASAAATPTCAQHHLPAAGAISGRMGFACYISPRTHSKKLWWVRGGG